MVLTGGIRREIALLARHTLIMRLLRGEPMGIVRLSHATNLPMHQVRYSMRIMQQNGLLEPSTKGAVLNEKGKRVHNDLQREIRAIVKELRRV